MIVVGIDGSESSRDALAWALAEARSRDARVTVVAAWHVATMAYAAPLALPVEGGIEHSFERSAELALAATLEDMGDAAKSIQVEQRVVAGPAAKVLVSEAEKAELLVVGSRGHGGFTGLLLGSVSQQCAQHAPCPVVIVRRPDS